MDQIFQHQALEAGLPYENPPKTATILGSTCIANSLSLCMDRRGAEARLRRKLFQQIQRHQGLGSTTSRPWCNHHGLGVRIMALMLTSFEVQDIQLLLAVVLIVRSAKRVNMCSYVLITFKGR